MSFDKDRFVGRDVLLNKKEKGVNRKLAGILVQGKRIPRQGYKILRKGEQIGVITSGNYSPNINSSIALGYMNSPYWKEGVQVKVEIRNALAEGTIVRLPFWKQGTAKKKSS